MSPNTTTMPTSTELRFLNGTPVCELTFRRVDLHKKQARFHGRYVLMPEIDLAQYTCRAVIDWLDIQITVIRHTQWRWIQDRIEKRTGEKTYVEDVVELDGTRGRRFKLRFQEPMLGVVYEAVDCVDREWRLDAKPELLALEVSLDFRPKSYSEKALAELYGVIARHHLPSRDVISDPADRPRFVASDHRGQRKTQFMLFMKKGKRDGSKDFLLRYDNDKAPTIDSTLYLGAKGSPTSWRLMVKRLDQQNKQSGTYRRLANEEVRVRLEVTVLGPELVEAGLKTLDDLRFFKFQTLQGSYFQFRLPSFRRYDQQSSLAQRVVNEELEKGRTGKFLTSGLVGLEAMDAAREQQRDAVRKGSRSTAMPLSAAKRLRPALPRYDALTGKVVQALRHLGERQSRSFGKQGKRP